MDDHTRERFALNGIRVMLLALVLGLVGGFLSLPVWTIGPGSFLEQPLSAYLVEGALLSVFERVLYAAALVGLLGALLIEMGRRDATHGLRDWWIRERVAIMTSVGVWAVFLASLSFLEDIDARLSLDLYIMLGTAAWMVTVITAGAYLLWTAERVAGSSVKSLGLPALALGYLSVGIVRAVNPLALTYLQMPIESWESVLYPLIIAGALLGEVSLALWIVVFAGILRGALSSSAPLSVAGEA